MQRNLAMYALLQNSDADTFGGNNYTSQMVLLHHFQGTNGLCFLVM